MFIPGLFSSGGESITSEREEQGGAREGKVQWGGQEQRPLIPQMDIFLGNSLSVLALTS